MGISNYKVIIRVVPPSRGCHDRGLATQCRLCHNRVDHGITSFNNTHVHTHIKVQKTKQTHERTSHSFFVHNYYLIHTEHKKKTNKKKNKKKHIKFIMTIFFKSQIGINQKF